MNKNVMLMVQFQPTAEMIKFLECNQEYRGILSAFPDCILVQKVCFNIFVRNIHLHSSHRINYLDPYAQFQDGDLFPGLVNLG